MEASICDPNVPSCEDAYSAAVHGEVETLMKFYMREPTSSINTLGDTIFHVLALNRHTKVAIELLNLSLPNNGLKTKNFNGNTALHEAARVGGLEIAELMVLKEEILVNDSNSMGETPLYWAVAWGQKAMFRFLAMKTSRDGPGLRRTDGRTILHVAVMGEFYDLALEIMDRYPDLAIARDKDGITALHLLVQSPSSFRSGTVFSDINLIYSSSITLSLVKLVIYFCMPSDADHKATRMDLVEHCETENQDSFLGENRKPGMIRQLFRWFPCLRSIDDEKQKHKLALKLATLLIKKESACMKRGYYIGQQPFQALNIGPSGTVNTINDTLMLAARHGIVEVVDVILKECHWAIESVDENGKNILHIAAGFCKFRVFALLISKGYLMTKLAANVDNNGNTALHLAANFANHRHIYIHIPAYKMTVETAWFKMVQGVSPMHMSQFRNSNDKTANELFECTHQNLIKESMEWIKSTANTAMLLSALIAAMNFTAAFGVPGGYEQNTGLPILAKLSRDLPLFYAYASTGLFFCVGTLAASLSAYLSRLQMNDFYLFLPFQYLTTGTCLLCSAIYTVTTFVQLLICVTNGEFKAVQWSLALTATIIAIISFIFIYVDAMFPVVQYFVYGISNKISYQGVRM